MQLKQKKKTCTVIRLLSRYAVERKTKYKLLYGNHLAGDKGKNTERKNFCKGFMLFRYSRKDRKMSKLTQFIIKNNIIILFKDEIPKLYPTDVKSAEFTRKKASSDTLKSSPISRKMTRETGIMCISFNRIPNSQMLHQWISVLLDY